MYFISNRVYIYCYQHKHHSRLFNNCLNICQNGSNSGGLFALLVSGAPHFQLSNGASAVQSSGVAAGLFMFLDCMALWTCKGDISDFKACNYYSFCLLTAIYTGNTVLAHLGHLACHPFAMQYVPPPPVCHCLATVRTLFEHFNIFVLDCLLCRFQILLDASFPMVPLPSKSVEWLLSYLCF